MQLSDAPTDDLRVIRDGIFNSLGFLSYRSDQMLVFLEDARFLSALGEAENVTCVITTKELAAQVPEHLAVGIAADPRGTFYDIHSQLCDTDFYFQSFPTEIAASASVHPRAYVSEKDVRIGERVTIEPNATILPRTIIEDDVTVRAGAVIGSRGFQVVLARGELLSVKHGGGVRLEEGSEVQSNACVDCALFGGETRIGKRTVIDNLVHIAHNVKLGKNNRVIAGAMVAGSVQSGDNVWIGPMASVSSELLVGDGATVTIGSVVTRNVPDGERFTGNFAIPHERFLEFLRSIR